jgi:renalase
VSKRDADLSCLIVGAGLSGLIAARRLADGGRKALIIERERAVGGRLAALRMEPEATSGRSKGAPAVFDYGAQFFTVREDRFEQIVAEWQSEGIVQEWSRGFATGDGSYYADGYPRYRAVPDMAAIARQLGRGLDVRTGVEVTRLTYQEERWRVVTAGGESYQAANLILTPPVPLSLDLLDAGGLVLPGEARSALERISYEPCIALLVQAAGAGHVPEPGGMWPVGGPLSWIADNHKKGISIAEGAITIHAAPEFSEEYWDAPDEAVAGALLEAAGDWIGSGAQVVGLYRWRYSKPLWIHPEPCLALSRPGPLLFAGDAFAGPRLEGAALSGLAAADRLLEHN